MTEKAEAIAALNDQARRGEIPCRVLLTRGVQSLGADALLAIAGAVRQFRDFAAGDDPYGSR
jgi:hypothetical protein